MSEIDLIVFESDSDNNDYDDDEDYKQMFTANLSNVELNTQLTTALELIVNENDSNRASHLIKLSNLLLSFGTKLEDDQLRNALERLELILHIMTTKCPLVLNWNCILEHIY